MVRADKKARAINKSVVGKTDNEEYKDTLFDKKQIRHYLTRIRVNLIRLGHMIIARYLPHINLKIYT